MYIPNLSVVCFFICLSYFIFYCALLLFCAQAWHGKTLSSRNDPIFFCSLHWRNLSLYNTITTTHFKQIRFWWKNVITFRGKVYSNFFKFVQQLFFLSEALTSFILRGRWMLESDWLKNILRCAVIFRETHSERSSRQLSWPHDHFPSPNDFCYFKGLITAK